MSSSCKTGARNGQNSVRGNLGVFRQVSSSRLLLQLRHNVGDAVLRPSLRWRSRHNVRVCRLRVKSCFDCYKITYHSSSANAQRQRRVAHCRCFYASSPVVLWRCRARTTDLLQGDGPGLTKKASRWAPHDVRRASKPLRGEAGCCCRDPASGWRRESGFPREQTGSPLTPFSWRRDGRRERCDWCVLFELSFLCPEMP